MTIRYRATQHFKASRQLTLHWGDFSIPRTSPWLSFALPLESLQFWVPPRDRAEGEEYFINNLCSDWVGKAFHNTPWSLKSISWATGQTCFGCCWNKRRDYQKTFWSRKIFFPVEFIRKLLNIWMRIKFISLNQSCANILEYFAVFHNVVCNRISIVLKGILV